MREASVWHRSFFCPCLVRNCSVSEGNFTALYWMKKNQSGNYDQKKKRDQTSTKFQIIYTRFPRSLDQVHFPDFTRLHTLVSMAKIQQTLVDSLQGDGAWGLEALALAMGIDATGSFQCENPTSSSLTSEQQRSRLVKASEFVPDIKLNALPPPSHGINGAVFSRNTLLPSDYYGLGVDPETGIFSLQLLDTHIAQMPVAVDSVLRQFFANHGACLACQAVSCQRVIKKAKGCEVASCCLLSVFCPECVAAERNQLPCRQCLRRATIDLPPNYMLQRTHAVKATLTESIRQGTLDPLNQNCTGTLIELLAPMALYRLSLCADSSKLFIARDAGGGDEHRQ